MPREKVADTLADFIENRIKPIVEKNRISFISSIDGTVQLGAENREELKKEVVHLFRGMLKSGFVSKHELKQLISEV